VVDYIGIANELKKALKNYTDAKGRGEPTLRAEEAFSVLLEKMDVVRGLFHSFDYSDFEDKAYQLLVPAANHILGLDDGKKRFLDAVLAISKAYSLCSTLDEAKELRAEIAFFSAIETAQVIEELIEMAKEFEKALNRDAELGLNQDEVAFYDALANNESAVRELGDEILKKIAIEITDKLRKSTTVDWQVRDSVRAKLRILVRRTLQRYKYPPDMAAEAVELVLKQAEVLSNTWTH